MPGLPPPDSLPKWAFVVVAFLALALALATALGVRPGDFGAQRGAVAIVNGQIIQETEYIRALDAMQAGLERSLTAEDRERALRILIDEELIVQHALDLDLARSDRMTRKSLIQALINSSLLLDTAAEPIEDELKALYESDSQLFAAQLILTVKVVAAPPDEETTNTFRQMVAAGTPFAEAAAFAGFNDISPPERLPPGKLADYSGALVRDTVLAMNPGDIAGPLVSGDQHLFVWLTEKTGNTTASFNAVRQDVEAEWRRRQEEEAFERYMDRLRRTARIRPLIDPEAVDTK